MLLFTGFYSQSYEIALKKNRHIFGCVGVGIRCDTFLLDHELYIEYLAISLFFIFMYLKTCSTKLVYDSWCRIIGTTENN